nr:hypothetical protein [Tanacetum cinerariifolium]
MDAEYVKKLQEELDKEHEEAYKQIDLNAALDHVQAKEPQYIKRYHGIKKKPQSEFEARKNMIFYLKNTEGFKMEFFKGKTYDEILPIFQARFDANLKFLFKSREEMEKEDEEIIKSINETPAQKETKRRKLSEEAQEADDLKKRLEIVQDEDDDVFVEATPLAQKVPVVDYQVVVIDNKPKYKIIRADDTHQFYISFTTLLKNFDREDLETLWRIVKDRFSTSKPTNFSDEYLLLTLKTMFGELDEQDAIWINQKSVHGLALVKRWKLLTSCVVHVIILLTVQLFLLVERRNVTILKVYFVEGLGHNLFFVGQFCDSDMEVSPTYLLHSQFRWCRSANWFTRKQSLYFVSTRYDGVLTYLSFVQGFKDQVLALASPFITSELCKKKSHKPKSEDTNQEKIYLLHMDLYGPMRVESINGKKYILIIVDDYSRFTWVKCLRSKDEAIDFIIKFLKMIQVRLKVPVRQAVATTCYTQYRSIIRLYHEKTPYELLHNKLPNLSFLHVFSALCYPTNDSENLRKLQPKADIRIFIGYAPTKKAFWIYNRRTRQIVETIHVDVDELTTMASEQSSSGPALNEMTPATISSGLMQKPSSSTPYVPPLRNDWDLLFQPMFDELLNPSPSVDPQAPKVIASIAD